MIYIYCMLNWEQYYERDRNCDVHILRFELPFHESFHNYTQGRIPHYFLHILGFKQEVYYCFFCNTQDCDISVSQVMLYCVSVLALIIFFMFLKMKITNVFYFLFKTQLELEKLLGRKWTEDSDVISCSLCQREFSLIVRKHHCRNCGQIFCNECSSKMAPIASNKKPVRVCDACYNELGSKQ